MPFPPPRKGKGKADFALLMADPKDKPKPGDSLDDSEPDDMGDDDFESDPGADGDDTGGDDYGDDTLPSIDPEQASLAKTLGFHEPEQQQALIDLIKLVNSSDSMGGADSGSDLPALPESPY